MLKIDQRFKKSITYKRIGLIIIFASVIPRIISTSVISYILFVLLLLIGITLEYQYKCPYCKYRFDPRINPKDITYCPKCGTQLNTKDNGIRW